MPVPSSRKQVAVLLVLGAGFCAPVIWTPSLCVAQDMAATEQQTVTCHSCHRDQKNLLAESVHQELACRECHGGAESYTVAAPQAERLAARLVGSGMSFDHGASFSSKPARKDVPDVCGGCHADVERMNPYGLRTDQLVRYKTSGHGKTLYDQEDDRVAVCTDCHGSPHMVLPADDPQSRTHPLNVPDTCARCHENVALMDEFGLSVEVVSEYRDSVHGRLLFEQHDTGAPTCASCHGNHSAIPPGFSKVGAVCGRCHQQAAEKFAESIHGGLEDFEGCVPCHGGGQDRHFHQIERITQPTGMMVARYSRLLESNPNPTPEEINKAIHRDPKRIITHALPACLECHEDLEEDENLPKLFAIMDQIGQAERRYVETARRLDEIGRGVLLVDKMRFKFEDARTQLIALGPIQHTLDASLVAEKVAEVNAICDGVNQELDRLQAGLKMRFRLLVPIWVFSIAFSVLLYVKYKKLKAACVRPFGAEPEPEGTATVVAAEAFSRRGFLDWVIGGCSASVGAVLGIPAVLYLWPAAKGGESAKVEVEGASALQAGQSTMLQVAGKAVIVVRKREGFRAFSAICTHLGCLVVWDAGNKQFKCPCHAALFDEDGGVVSGPPPSALPEYQVKEVDDQVFVLTS